MNQRKKSLLFDLIAKGLYYLSTVLEETSATCNFLDPFHTHITSYTSSKQTDFNSRKSFMHTNGLSTL